MRKPVPKTRPGTLNHPRISQLLQRRASILVEYLLRIPGTNFIGSPSRLRTERFNAYLENALRFEEECFQREVKRWHQYKDHNDQDGHPITPDQAIALAEHGDGRAFCMLVRWDPLWLRTDLARPFLDEAFLPPFWARTTQLELDSKHQDSSPWQPAFIGTVDVTKAMLKEEVNRRRIQQRARALWDDKVAQVTKRVIRQTRQTTPTNRISPSPIIGKHRFVDRGNLLRDLGRALKAGPRRFAFRYQDTLDPHRITAEVVAKRYVIWRVAEDGAPGRKALRAFLKKECGHIYKEVEEKKFVSMLPKRIGEKWINIGYIHKYMKRWNLID